ncbi:MAG: peptidylprolyl isomerase [Flavobacteriales bacterium]|nr:peptidylprolyl isomerase [Flavobacteriales bacterium]
MALIGTIRKRGGWLVAIVVGMALLSFILTDFIGGGGTNTQVFEIGEIAGHVIPARSFEAEVQEAVNNYKDQRQVASVDQATIDAIREQIWNQKLYKFILGEEFANIGLSVHPEEVFNLIAGPQPSRAVVEAFSNPQTGQFNPAEVRRLLKEKDQDPTGETGRRYLTLENQVINDRLSAKYFNLIKKGLYITEKEAMLNYEFTNGSAKLKYVLMRYSSIPDSLIEVSERDIRNYYDDHRKEYEQDASRSIQYVTFDVLPSAEDSLDIQNWVNTIKEEIAKVKGIENISSFVNLNADTRYIDRYYKAGDLSSRIDSIMFASDSVHVEGPYIENGSHNVARWIESDERPDSVQARHILIATSPNGDSSHVRKADSLLNVIKEGSDFTLLAGIFSEDKGSAANGGDVGWFTEGTMVKPFNDTCFTGQVGDVKIAVSQFGAHIIEITDMTKPIKKVKVALIDRRIKPSSSTFTKIYSVVNKFAGESRTQEAFETNSNEAGLVIREAETLTANDKQIIGLESPREVIRWAYNVEKGAVSGPFELGNKYVVAVLTSVKEEGFATLEDIETEMEIGTRNKKKADYIIAKLEENDDQNLEDLAANLSANHNEFDLTVQEVARLSFSAFNVPGLGREPKLIGSIYGINPNELSSAVVGKAGVFLFILEELTPAPENQDYSANKTRLNSDLASRSDYEVFDALKKASDIIDDRHLFY